MNPVAADNGAKRPLRFAIIGAGMAGILSAIKLDEAGFSDWTIYEKADRLGGTWRENTYPGIGCDVPSHLYSYSFALNPEWSHAFAPGDEIQRYFEQVAHDYGIESGIRYGDAVASLEFREGCWHLETAAGHRDTVDVVIAATGVLHVPSYPEIEGLASFAGSMRHSARWDHSVPLAGKRIGVIGTGSTAVQIVSALVDEVAHLDLFQRTAQWVLPQENAAYSDEDKEAFRTEPERLTDLYWMLSELFADGFSNAVVDAESPQMRRIEEACLANLEQHVHDPELRERLRPNYRAACKRLIISPDFYEKIQRPNASLVTDAIERVEATGVRTNDGTLHELDVLVLATGFKVDSFTRPMRVIGRDGRNLDDAWAKRPEAYLAISVPGFPNFFMLNGPNGPVGNFSLIQIAELQFAYILQLVAKLRAGECREVCATRSALERFEAAREEAARHTVWVTGCRSWYLDDRGIPASWPWTLDRFRDAMASPDLDEYELV